MIQLQNGSQYVLLYHNPEGTNPQFPVDVVYTVSVRKGVVSVVPYKRHHDSKFDKVFKGLFPKKVRERNYKEITGEFLFRPAQTVEVDWSLKYRLAGTRSILGDCLKLTKDLSKYKAGTILRTGGQDYTNSEAYKNEKTRNSYYYGGDTPAKICVETEDGKSLYQKTEHWVRARPEETYAYYKVFEKPFHVSELEEALEETESSSYKTILKSEPDTSIRKLVAKKRNKKQTTLIFFK